MDFVEGLGDTSGILEIAVDGLGRAEILDGRLRLTLITHRVSGPAPAVCLVWTAYAFRKSRPNYHLLNEMLTGHLAEADALRLMTGGVRQHH